MMVVQLPADVRNLRDSRATPPILPQTRQLAVPWCWRQSGVPFYEQEVAAPMSTVTAQCRIALVSALAPYAPDSFIRSQRGEFRLQLRPLADQRRICSQKKRFVGPRSDDVAS